MQIRFPAHLEFNHLDCLHKLFKAKIFSFDCVPLFVRPKSSPRGLFRNSIHAPLPARDSLSRLTFSSTHFFIYPSLCVARFSCKNVSLMLLIDYPPQSTIPFNCAPLYFEPNTTQTHAHAHELCNSIDLFQLLESESKLPRKFACICECFTVKTALDIYGHFMSPFGCVLC